ncbi:MAG: alpha/beta fold hydrolase [Myxococcota bacterium]|nr:alpha/beta fold hydrolase [Myxococcota bacterium]
MKNPGRKLIRQGSRRARLAGERAVLRFVNGMDYFLADHPSVVEPEPYDTVLEEGKLLLRSYVPPEPEEVGLGAETLAQGGGGGLPVLFIPPLMIQPLVYDLREGHSFVGLLRSAGFHPYLVDFGNPAESDRVVSLDTYVLQWLPQVIRTMLEDSGRSDYAIVGYCMGGLFALMCAAVHADDELPGPSAIVTIGSPIDSAKMGLLSLVARRAHGQLDAVASHIGNVPGRLSSNVFKWLMPLRTVTGKADLFLNMWDEEWVRGHESIEAWIDGFLDYPQDAFRQFLRDFLKDNRLLDGTMTFGDRQADLKSITCPVLAFAGRTDKIVPVAAARATLGALGSRDVRFREVPGGHMGIVAGRRSPRTVWEPTCDFLKEISRSL